MALIEGSQTKRNCLSCKANKGDMEYYACGYLSKEKRRSSFRLDFPATKSATPTISTCPVYYYHKYEHLYKWFNIERSNNTYLRNMNFVERILYTSFKEYLSLKKEYLIKKMQEKTWVEKGKYK